MANAVTVGGNFAIGGATTTDALTLTGAVDLGAGSRTINLAGQGDTILSNTISDDGGGRTLTISSLGAGTLTLSGANTFGGGGGGLTLTSGTLLAGNNSAFGAGTLIINSGTLGASVAGVSVSNPLAIGGNFDLGGAAGTSLELTAAMNLGANTLTHSGVSNDTLSGNLTSAATGGITVTAGTLDLTGSNGGYAGTSTVTGGTLNLQGAGNYAGKNNVTGGTVNMSGALATYSGNSTVTDGTLNLRAGSYTGGLTLGANGIFNFTGGTFVPTGGANINTAAGSSLTIAPGLNLNIGGAGWTLTNRGTTTVNGTLTGDLTNNADSLVNGSGTITGALINNGTVNPGNSPGTLTVSTYTVNPGATHVEEIASASSYDKLITTAAGGITLNGGTLSPRLLGGYLPSTNQVFSNILQATGGGTVTGAFAGLDNNGVGSSRTLFWQALYNPTSVDLQAVGNYTPPDLALSRNQRSVGKALNSLAPSTNGGDMLTVLDAINALTTNAGVQAAYDDISPAKYAALSTMTLPITHLQFQYLQNRLARERWEAELGSEAVSAGGGGFMRGFTFGYDANTKMLLAASNLTVSDAGTPLIQKGMEQRWGIYLEPTANWGTLSPTANLVGYRYKNFGFTLGAEYWVMDNLLVGVNTGYSKTLAGVGGTGGDINANVIPFNAYSAFFMQGFYANATLGYTYSGYDMERNIAFGAINRTAKASTSGNQFQLGAETGYDAPIGNAVVGPAVSLQYVTQTTGAFTESNAGALSLRVGSQTADSVQSGLGARASYRARVGNVAVKPQLSVTWQHEFSDNPRGLNASLAAGGSTMNFRTDRIGQDFALISVDLPAKVTKDLVANLGYTAEVGRDKSSNMGVNLGLKLKW